MTRDQKYAIEDWKRIVVAKYLEDAADRVFRMAQICGIDIEDDFNYRDAVAENDQSELIIDTIDERAEDIITHADSDDYMDIMHEIEAVVEAVTDATADITYLNILLNLDLTAKSGII